ncbi:MAG: hypothetical protein AAF633_00535 [Chloroflexota bacterium]
MLQIDPDSTLLNFLADPAYDWPQGDLRAPSIWFRPTCAGNTFADHLINQQPMYRLRKHIARAWNRRTQDLPEHLLNALLNIETGTGTLAYAFGTGFDALMIGQMWGHPPFKRYRQTGGLSFQEHKIDQLVSLFPKGEGCQAVELTVFVGQGHAAYPGLGPHPGPGSIQAEVPDLIPAKDRDMANWFYFLESVWLVEIDQAVEPLSLPIPTLDAAAAAQNLSLKTDLVNYDPEKIRAFRKLLLNTLR